LRVVINGQEIMSDAAVKSKDMAGVANGAPKPDGLADLTKKDEREAQALSAHLQRSEALGARVMEFDEDATPEQKAAAAKKKMNEIKPPKAEKEGGGLGLASDIGGQKVHATLNSADVDRISKLEGQQGDGKGKAGQPTSTIPDYYQVGHTGVAKHMLDGQPGLQPGEEETRRHIETELVSKYLTDQWYGRFWFDGAACIVAVLATYFSTRFGGGIPVMLVIGAVVTTYYNTSTRRTRQRHRDDISRELAKTKMMTDAETAGWINQFLRRFWLIYEPVLSATIISTVDAILVQQCPSFLDSIRLTTFTLGTKAPIIDFVRTFPSTADDIVCMDWKISFTPNDTQDLTVRQAAQKVNPKVCLTIRIGRGIVGAGLPILVEDISFSAHARIKMKLISTFPHIQTVDVSLMSPPTFDFVLKPIGGNTFGFDIMSVVPGLEGFIKGQVDANMGPMMYNPNVFTVNLEELLSGTPLDTACGVLQITVWNARNLRGVKLGGGTPDPYVAVAVDDKEVLAKTKYKPSTNNPQFKSSHFILLNSLNGMLTLNVMDFNERRSDTKLGTAAFELKELELEPEQTSLSTPVMLEGKERGTLQYALSYYPVIKPETGADGKPIPLPETHAGVVRLTIHQAKNLEKRVGILGDCNPKARILLNGNKVKDTAVLKRTTSPIWEEHFEFLVTERRKAVVGVQIIDHDTLSCLLNVKLDDLLSAKDRQQDWFPLSRSKEGRIRMSAEWKPVSMSGSMNGGSGYTPAIGVMKFWMHKAIGVKNVEAAMGGKSDPYAALRVRGQQVDATTIVNNDLNPDWKGEILYAPVHSLKEKIVIEVMDYQNNTKDRSIGTCEVNVADLIKETPDDQRHPYATLGKHSHTEKLSLGRGIYKGEIVYDCQFLPSLNLAGVEFSGAGNEAAAKAGEGDEDGGDPDADAKGASDVKDVVAPDVAAVNGGGEKHEEKKRFPVVGGTHTKNKASIASMQSAKTAATSDTAGENKLSGVSMSREELLGTQSGILVFNILYGKLAHRNARLEVSFDDGYWPAYTTEEARTTASTWDEVGEAVIKELDWSRIWLKLRTGNGKDDNSVFAEFQGNTKDFLERALDKEAEFQLASDAGTGQSTVTITCKYIPTDIKIEPVESVNNMGFLTVWAVGAKNLRGADRGGKSSDPYVAFSLNGERMMKSKVIKKTLNPTWDEKLGECEVPSRVHAEAVFEVFDWDQVGNPDKLGNAIVDLGELEPFEPFEKTYSLSGKGALDDSSLTLKFIFRPEFISNRTRKGTSLGRTFTAGVGGVGRLGVGAAGLAGKGVGTVGKGAFGVVGGVGKGVGGVGKGAFGLVRGRHASHSDGGVPAVPELPEGIEPAAIAPDGMPVNNSSAMGLNKIADNASIAESSGTEKRRSRIHNPFSRKH
jgi:Ca2+-dependent lipid-binding protein